MEVFDVIKCEADNLVPIWKFQGEDFNTLSQLVVNSSQEAVLCIDKEVLDVFPNPGNYTLHTQNIPLLSNYVHIPSDKTSFFHCEVYFINKDVPITILWGTGNIGYMDFAVENHMFAIGASGNINIKIVDSKKIAGKLFITEKILDKESICQTIKQIVIKHVKAQLPAILQDRRVSVLELDKDLDAISLLVKDRVAKEIEEYGVLLDEFRVNTIRKPESDPVYRALKRKKKEGFLVRHHSEMELGKKEVEQTVPYKTEEDEVVEFEIRVKKLIKAKEAGLITEEQFELHKKKLLDSI